MSVVTDRTEALEIMERFEKQGISMAVLGTSSHWNTEAILLAASLFAEEYQISDIAVSVSMTGTYEHWPQAVRSTYSGDYRAGLLSNMEHLRVLCGDSSSPYARVMVLPHLDHAHPEKDKWALTDGLSYFASVMFDAQTYSLAKNRKITAEYVEQYGDRVVIEGIADQLGVDECGSANYATAINSRPETDEVYAQKIKDYVEKTGVDYVVADLGTEQQSRQTGLNRYLQRRAKLITEKLGKPKLVLHGTSCLDGKQMQGLADDGIARVNMWTRIAREAGQHAAKQLLNRIERVRSGDLMAADSCEYMRDSTTYASGLIQEILRVLGYDKL